MEKFSNVNNLVNSLKPVNPIYCIRPDTIKNSIKVFKDKFPGKVLYAVKTNPNEYVLKHVIKNGIDRFDVASINEVKLIRKLGPKSKLYFMHPIKSREDIAAAYFDYNVRDFSLDTKEELMKILDSTRNAKDLNLFVRVAVSNEHAELDLSRKFGALTSEALGLVRLCKQHAKKLGVSFHVGAQCMHKISFSKGLKEISNIIRKTKIIPDTINVGGGFPSLYPDLKPEPLENYFDEINLGLKNLKLEKMPEVICEPGRALVAESGSTIARVNLRKKDKLYINDGTYGSLFDAGVPNFILPTRLITNGRIQSKKITAFQFYGPTCDSLDYMKGPFLMPNNIKEGDYIELGQLGAYGLTFRTKFNGFYSDTIVELKDKPIMSLYNDTGKFNYLVA